MTYAAGYVRAKAHLKKFNTFNGKNPHKKGESVINCIQIIHVCCIRNMQSDKELKKYMLGGQFLKK